MAGLLKAHQDAVERLAEVPGLGVDSAQQIIAEVDRLRPHSARRNPFPHGSVSVRAATRLPASITATVLPRVIVTCDALLHQVANAGARTKESIFEIVYRRMVPRLGHDQSIGAVAHRQCRLIWLILHEGVRYEERGSGLTKRSKQLRTWKMIRELRNLGYQIEHPFLNRAKHPCIDFRPCSSCSISSRKWVTS